MNPFHWSHSLSPLIFLKTLSPLSCRWSHFSPFFFLPDNFTWWTLKIPECQFTIKNGLFKNGRTQISFYHSLLEYNSDTLHLRWLNIKGFYVTFPISITLFTNHLHWNRSIWTGIFGCKGNARFGSLKWTVISKLNRPKWANCENGRPWNHDTGTIIVQGTCDGGLLILN